MIGLVFFLSRSAVEQRRDGDVCSHPPGVQPVRQGSRDRAHGTGGVGLVQQHDSAGIALLPLSRDDPSRQARGVWAAR